MQIHTNHLCLKGDTFKFKVQSRPDDYRALTFFLLVASNCPNMTPRKFCFHLNRTNLLTLTERHVEKHLCQRSWQPRSEPDRGGGPHQRRKQRNSSSGAASSWILLCPCGLEPPNAPPPSACEILHGCGRLRENTWKRQKHV